MRYFYADQNRQPVGPLEADEVLGMYRNGVLNGNSPLIAEGASTWGTVDTLLRPPRTMAYPPPYAPPYAPAETAVCRACGARLPRNAEWCPVCHASTRDFVDGTLASPLRRLGASILDQAIPMVLGATLGVTMFETRKSIVASVVFLAYGIWACTLYSRGTTPGKNILGMVVLDEDGDPAGFWRMLGREWIGKFFSALVFGVGYLWILIDDERQGWHDKMFGTHVVKLTDEG